MTELFFPDNTLHMSVKDISAAQIVDWRLLIAANVKYIWPLQAPLADGGAQRKRLNAVRQELGWQVIGCDYIECFQ